MTEEQRWTIPVRRETNQPIVMNSVAPMENVVQVAVLPLEEHLAVVEELRARVAALECADRSIAFEGLWRAADKVIDGADAYGSDSDLESFDALLRAINDLRSEVTSTVVMGPA